MRGESVEAGFQVGPWRVEPALYRLENDGVRTRIEPKVMAVLVHLATRAGEVVGRDELLDVVWRSRHVSDDLPRRAIYALRKVFGDDPKRPAYIETIPRAGYRLLVPVLPVAETTDDSTPADPMPRSVPRAARSRTHRYLALIGGVLVVALAFSGFLRGDRLALASRPRAMPLTSSPGLEYDPALSPDGSRVAFVHTSGSALDAEMTLHVQLVGESTSLRLTDEPASFDAPIESPTWSADGTRIAYLRWRPMAGWSVCEISALGGLERKRLTLGTAGAAGLSWSPGGKWLALGRRSSPGQPLALHRFALDEGILEPLTDPPATSVGDHHPAWSPDGSEIAFVRTLVPDGSEVHVVAAAGGPSRAVVGGNHKIADLDWSADGRHLVVAMHDGGRHRLWRVEVATGEIEALPALGDDTRFVSVARQGARLTFARTEYTFGVWQLNLDTGTITPLPALSSTFFDAGFHVSPDGRLLALTSTRAGAADIWISDLEGKHPVRLTTFAGGGVGHPRWLPDGQSVVFHAQTEGTFDLWSVDRDGGTPRRLAPSPSDDRVPSPSRDGRIVFASNRSAEWQLWRLPVDGGTATQITRHGGYFAQESLDGQWLYYTRWRTDGLWRVPRGGGDEIRVLDDALREREWGNWAVAEEGIYFVTRDAANRVEIALYSPREARVVRRLPVDGTPVQPSLTLIPNGRSVLFAQLDRLESDLMLVDGWRPPDG